MTRTKQKDDSNKKQNRIRRIPDQKKIVNNRQVKLNDINVKKFLDTVKSDLHKSGIAAYDAGEMEEKEEGETKIVIMDEKAAVSEEPSSEVEIGTEKALEEHIPTLEEALPKESQPENNVDNNNANRESDGIQNKDEEVWQKIELVGLSPESQKLKSKQKGESIEETENQTNDRNEQEVIDKEGAPADVEDEKEAIDPKETPAAHKEDEKHIIIDTDEATVTHREDEKECVNVNPEQTVAIQRENDVKNIDPQEIATTHTEEEKDVKYIDPSKTAVSEAIQKLGDDTEDGYKSGDEGDSQSESDVPEDSVNLEERLRKPDPKDNEDAGSEEDEAVADENVEQENVDHNFSQESEGGYSDDENESESDVVIESDNDWQEEKKEEEEAQDLKSPSFVPRRTGFWDHDDRFADIPIEETREPQRNRKLWDKSEVDRWQHDMYNESEQGPKEDWEVKRSREDYEERDRRRSGGRGGRNFGDFIQDANRFGGGGKGGYDRGGRHRGQGRQRRDDMYQRDINRGDTFDSREEQSIERSELQSNKSPNQREESSLNWQEKQSYRNDRQKQNYRNKNQSNERRYEESYQQGYPYRENQERHNVREGDRQQRDRERGRDNKNKDRREDEQIDLRTSGGFDQEASRERQLRDERHSTRNRETERGDEKRDTRKNSDRRNDSNKRSPPQNKSRTQKGYHGNDEQVERNKEDQRRVDEGGTRKTGKGRGRGITDTNFTENRRADGFARDKSNREKRIENLPPRLRDKEREKMENHEKSKDKHSRDQDDDDVYEDAQEVSEVQSPDDGGARDKPKRYSSQRQKTGTSMMDIPGQIPEDEDGKAQYYNQLGLIQQTMYNAQLAALQHQQSQNQGIMSNKGIASLEQQILHLQSQLQQQLNLRSTQPQAVPNMMSAHPNIQMQMANMVPQMVQSVDQQPQVYNNDSMYSNMNPPLITNLSTDGMPIANPQINPMILNQIMAAAGVQQQLPGGGLFVAPPQTSQQQQQQHQQQQVQMTDADHQQHLRRARPAAIPIKPPPGL